MADPVSYWTNIRAGSFPIHSEICRRLVPQACPWGPYDSTSQGPSWAGPFATLIEAKAAHPRPDWVSYRYDDSPTDGWLCECVSEGTPGESIFHDAEWRSYDNRFETLRDLQSLQRELES